MHLSLLTNMYFICANFWNHSLNLTHTYDRHSHTYTDTNIVSPFVIIPHVHVHDVHSAGKSMVLQIQTRIHIC